MKEKQIQNKINAISEELLKYQSLLIAKQNPRPPLTEEEQKEKIEEVFQAAKNNKERKEHEVALEKELGLSYRHFKEKGQSKGPIVSMGWKVYKKDNDLDFEYTIAICSKNDFFDRGFARFAINERFKMGYTIKFSVVNMIPAGYLAPQPAMKGESELVRGHYNAHRIQAELFGMKDIPMNARFIP